MNSVLWREHPCWSVLVLKWIAMTISTAMVWFGAVTYMVAAGEVGDPWFLLSLGWLFPALFLLFGPLGDRASEFALQLPVDTGRIWTVHVSVLVTLTLILTVGSLGPVTWILLLLASPGAEDSQSARTLVDLLPSLWLHGGAWSLFILAVTIHHRPELAHIPRDRAWTVRQCVVGLVAGAGVFGLGARGGHLPGLLVAAGSVAWLLIGWRRLPRTLVLWPHEARDPGASGRQEPLADTLVWWRRQPLWLTIMLGGAKHPMMNLISLPFVVLMGLWNSSWVQGVLGIEHMSVAFLAITAYMFFVLVASPLFRFSRFDWLPVSRDKLLLCLFMPLIIMAVAGYGLGEYLSERGGRTPDEPLIFSAEPETYGLRMSSSFFKLAVGEAPVQITPSGTEIQPPATWRLHPLDDVVLYKPYHTPLGASLDDCAWQLERASADIFGEAIAASVFKERYLEVNEHGVVVPRTEDGLTLMADFPGLRPQRFAGLAPLQTLLVVILTQASCIVLLAFYRPGVSATVRKRAYGLVLTVLLGLHIGQFILDIFNLMDLDALSVAAYAVSDLAVAATPLGVWGPWLVVLVVLAAGHWLMQQQFRRAEFVPAREGDLFSDVLG